MDARSLRQYRALRRDGWNGVLPNRAVDAWTLTAGVKRGRDIDVSGEWIDLENMPVEGWQYRVKVEWEEEPYADVFGDDEPFTADEAYGYLHSKPWGLSRSVAREYAGQVAERWTANRAEDREYVMLDVQVRGPNGEGGRACLGFVESDPGYYLPMIADELLPEAINDATKADT